MIVKITSKRQVTFPRHVMERLHLREGDMLTVTETEDGIMIKPLRFNPDGFAPLQKQIDPDLPEPDFEAIRHAALDPCLRD